MTRRVRLIYLGSWLAAAVGIHLLLGVGSSLAMAFLFMALALGLTWPVRSVPLASIFLAFFVGLLAVSHASVLVELLVKGTLLPPVFSSQGKLLDGMLLAPVAEESLKVAPVLGLLLWRRSRARVAFGASDLMLYGLAIGVGFVLFEDMLKGPALLSGVRSTGPTLAGIPLVPWAELQSGRGRPDVVYLGHAAGTAFVGLALGWARYLHGKVRYVPALAVWIWVTWSHALFNGVSDLQRGSIFFATAPLTAAAPWAFLVAAVATVIYEWRLLRQGVPALERDLAERLHRSRPALISGTAGWLTGGWQWLRCRDLIRQLGYARLWLRFGHGQPQKAAAEVEHLILPVLMDLDRSLGA